MNFTEAEIETIKSLLLDHGSDCPDTDSDALQALGEKLGVYKPIEPPTAEELKRREELANSPAGKMMRELFEATNRNLAQSMADQIVDLSFFDGQQWGDTLRVRLPNDYQVKDTINLIDKSDQTHKG